MSFSSTTLKLFSKIYKRYIIKKVTIFIRKSSQKIIIKIIKTLSTLTRGYNIYSHYQIQQIKVLDFYNIAASISTLKYRHFHTRVTDLERDHFEY